MKVDFADSETLKDYFSKFGPVSYFKMAKNKKNKDPLGFGFLEFKEDSIALKVLGMKHSIGGREVMVFLLGGCKAFQKRN